MISLGVIWTWRKELYSRIFRMSSRLKSLLTIGFVIVLIISFQKYGERINQQILVTLQYASVSNLASKYRSLSIWIGTSIPSGSFPNIVRCLPNTFPLSCISLSCMSGCPLQCFRWSGLLFSMWVFLRSHQKQMLQRPASSLSAWTAKSSPGGIPCS